VFALLAAQSRDFEIDEENLARQVEHTFQHLKRGLANYQIGKGQGGGVLTAGYALWTLDESLWQPDEVTTSVTHYLLQHQNDQPHWRQRGQRPPSSGSDYTATYVALRGLGNFGTTEQQTRIQERRQAAIQWLKEAQPSDTEDLVFRIGALNYAGAEDELIASAAEDLLSQQRRDGGWGQQADMQSDPYATATALALMMKDGGIETVDPRVQSGIEYLLRNQLADGTWHVATRANPVQDYFESGFPHGVDQFISIAASGWATVALLHCLPEHEPASPSAEHAEGLKSEQQSASELSSAP
jgi:hypothetical protein